MPGLRREGCGGAGRRHSILAPLNSSCTAFAAGDAREGAGKAGLSTARHERAVLAQAEIASWVGALSASTVTLVALGIAVWGNPTALFDWLQDASRPAFAIRW
jgi:hypothetical protein